MSELFSTLDVIPFDFWGAPVYLDNNGQLQCPGFSGKTYQDSAWDKLEIGGVRTPGKVHIHSKKFRDIDKKKASGGDGARITIHGIEPALVEIQIIIWTPAQLEALRVIWQTVFPPNNKRPTSAKNSASWPPVFVCYHPELAFKKINKLQFTDGEGPVDGPFPRSKVFTMKAVEFMPPGKSNVTATPAAALPTTHDGVQQANTSYLPPGEDRTNLGPVAAEPDFFPLVLP